MVLQKEVDETTACATSTLLHHYTAICPRRLYQICTAVRTFNLTGKI